MEIAGNEYRVHRARDSAKVIFEGTLRLSGTKAYKPIAQLLQTVGEDGTDIVTLDMRKLQFLNSARSCSSVPTFGLVPPASVG